VSENRILCEGYHDRAFWAGWLLRLGCVDPGAGSEARLVIYDPWNTPVTKGIMPIGPPAALLFAWFPVMERTESFKRPAFA
jgi:hypothetical protein